MNINPYLTNRNLNQFKQPLLNAIVREINSHERFASGMTVLDVPCGCAAIALSDLLAMYQTINGIGVDEGIETLPTNSRLALYEHDVFEHDPSPVADVAYSAYFFAGCALRLSEDYVRNVAFVTNYMANSLNKGGIGIIHDDLLSKPELRSELSLKIQKEYPDFFDRFDLSYDSNKIFDGLLVPTNYHKIKRIN